jgi:hypothetical protein
MKKEVSAKKVALGVGIASAVGVVPTLAFPMVANASAALHIGGSENAGGTNFGVGSEGLNGSVAFNGHVELKSPSGNAYNAGNENWAPGTYEVASTSQDKCGNWKEYIWKHISGTNYQNMASATTNMC